MTIVHQDGTARIRLIAPGKGSSGYYSEALLRRSAPKFSNVFMFWNHAPRSKDLEQPEGDLRNLAGKIQGTPTYEAAGKYGPGLYADVHVFKQYRESVEELGPHIGVSIRALGQSRPGKVNGETLPIVEDIKHARSVDFVTAPGAGGRVLELFEAARDRLFQSDQKEDHVDEKDLQALREAYESETRQLREQVDQLTQGQQRLQEAAILREAQDLATVEVRRSTLPDLTKARVIRDAVAHVPLKEGAIDREVFATQITEGIRQAAAEVSQALGGGQVRGLGGSGGQTEELTETQARTRLEESFRLSGMSESAAKLAASGGR